MGSTIKQAILSPFLSNNSLKASTLLNGTSSMPGTNGPKPSLESGSSDIDTAARDRP